MYYQQAFWYLITIETLCNHVPSISIHGLIAVALTFPFMYGESSTLLSLFVWYEREKKPHVKACSALQASISHTASHGKTPPWSEAALTLFLHTSFVLC